MKKRIWELDALRGLCILGVVAVHFVYDLNDLYRVVSWDLPDWYLFIKQWGGIIFLVLSGVCVTLGKRSMRRGALVFCGGLLVSAVTLGMYLFGMADRSIIIYFGVLHCLGVCMMIWPLFRDYHWLTLLALGMLYIVLGFLLRTVPYPGHRWLLAFGVGGMGSDYFPLLPNLGYFLVGAAIGRTLYKNGQSLMPKVNEKFFIIRFFCFCGRQSLWIYLLHQPILSGICYLLLQI